MGVMCRARVFAKPDFIRLASREFVPVTESLNKILWQKDDDTLFYQKVYDQAPQSKKRASGQGIYIVTADGELLHHCTSFVAGQRGKQEIEKGLAAWRQLPASRRSAGAIHVPLSSNLKTHHAPDGGLVLRVYSRQLEETGSGSYIDATCQVGRGDEASFDNMWLKQDEWKSLIPKSPAAGRTYTIPQNISQRIARAHLRDRTRGMFPAWPAKTRVRSNMTLTVLPSAQYVTRLRVNGSALIGQRNISDQGYDARIGGRIEFDRRQRKITRFDLVAIGDQWGKPDVRAREGFNPLGVAFELSDGRSPRDHIPPGGVGGDMRAYFRR